MKQTILYCHCEERSNLIPPVIARNEAIQYFRFSPACFVIIITLFVCLSGCKFTGSSGSGQAGQVDATMVETPIFTHPEAPAMIIYPNLRLEYVIRHYWDYFDFADTAYLPTPDITEQAWVNYLDLLYRIPQNQAQEEMKAMMT